MAELFNKEALQALDDKSELKEMPRVASPALWLILTSLLTICAIALFWCIFGKLNYTVNATGVVFPFAEARPISVPFEGTVHHVIATNGQKVAAGDPIASVRSQLATTTLTSPESGVVLTSKPAETKFVAREPVVWILPQELQLHEREVLAYVPFAHLRKVKIGAKVQVTPADLEREKWGYAVGTVTGIERYPTARQAVAQRLKLAELAAIIPAEQPVYEVRIVLDRGADGLIWSRKKSQNMAVTTGMPCNVQIIWSQKYVWEVLTGRLDNMLETLQGK
jgi:multidrug efflux pump subunit AcrA (membrane-fusion protein)